ncbi:MAG: hypothetical protein A2Y14_03205 [Verrucomicrobia bacterium GWF2_51_19]|nr:MAG: hypothetical protein A2Y14_03205 [Verrucomicrobia bacterium GWF2_51_19]HCJ12374.1 hypothetical protein [Opitutae bacterium]
MTDEIQTFGENIGIPGLAFNKHGVIHLSIENVGELFFETNENHLLIYLLKDYAHDTDSLLWKALNLSHTTTFDFNRLFNPILTENNFLGFLFRFNKNDLQLPDIYKALDQLKELHDLCKIP